MNENKNENANLKQRTITIGLALNKKRKIYKMIFFSIVLIILIGLATLIILLFKDKNVEIVSRAVIVSAIVIFLISFYTSDWVVCNISKSIKSMVKELDLINDQMYPKVFAAHDINKFVKETSLIDKIKLVIGVSLLIIGFIAIITDFIIVVLIPIEVFFIILILAIWIEIYSFFIMFSRRLLRKIIYPTMTLLTIAFPPLLTAWLVRNEQEWLKVLSICLGVVIGFFLFALFIYFAVYYPGKESRLFIKENRDLFEEREADKEGFMCEIINKKLDRALISVCRKSKHNLIIEKWICDKSPHFEKLKEIEFKEYRNAYNIAIKEIVELYQIKDERPEVELEQRSRKLAEANINEFIEKLLNDDYFKNKIDRVNDELIAIKFHKYLTVLLGDDYCEYFNTHWHPSDNEDAAEFIDTLINEQVIFYENRLSLRRKQYDGIYLDKLLKTKNHKFCRVYSAMKIYIDN